MTCTSGLLTHPPKTFLVETNVSDFEPIEEEKDIGQQQEENNSSNPPPKVFFPQRNARHRRHKRSEQSLEKQIDKQNSERNERQVASNSNIGPASDYEIVIVLKMEDLINYICL